MNGQQPGSNDDRLGQQAAENGKADGQLWRGEDEAEQGAARGAQLSRQKGQQSDEGMGTCHISAI